MSWWLVFATRSFFWDDDLETPLEDRAEDLEGVLFHQKLGSYRAKTRRVVPLATAIAANLRCSRSAGAPGGVPRKMRSRDGNGR